MGAKPSGASRGLVGASRSHPAVAVSGGHRGLHRRSRRRARHGSEERSCWLFDAARRRNRQLHQQRSRPDPAPHADRERRPRRGRERPRTAIRVESLSGERHVVGGRRGGSEHALVAALPRRVAEDRRRPSAEKFAQAQCPRPSLRRGRRHGVRCGRLTAGAGREADPQLSEPQDRPRQHARSRRDKPRLPVLRPLRQTDFRGAVPVLWRLHRDHVGAHRMAGRGGRRRRRSGAPTAEN